MNVIQNPILRGFNPDPSIIRVGADYYIATSTFEWFPGVQIHHSTDLQNWTLVARPLKRLSQLNMLGVPDSCGVWAPCLSYDNGTFYLVFSNVKSFDGVWKDTPNYLVTTNDILGDWSEPIFLSAIGFDGSLFHDSDGTKWFTSMRVDHREEKMFGGIILQAYSPERKKVVGPVYHIFEGSELGVTEAPHLYKRGDYYYLITAEGGTEYDHAVSLARSETITGPYDVHPENPVITARNHPYAPLQKAGHADLVSTENGDWYAVFLVGRPLTIRGRCTLGRETAIAKVEWREDDWLYLEGDDKWPELEVSGLGNDSMEESTEKTNTIIDFNSENLNIHFQSLRVPITEEWLTLKERPGFCRLYGRESLSSFHFQSLIARRIQHFDIEVTTCVEFEPESFQEMAGLVCYYNTAHWHYLHILGAEVPLKKYLQITSCDNFSISEELAKPIDISHKERIYLKVTFQSAAIKFYYATSENQWQPIGSTLDGSILSDDYVRGQDRYRPAFTGAFVGICCQDLTGQKNHADFAWFAYKET